MTTTLTCPDETELLALAMGEPVGARVTAHVGGCSKCQTTLDQLQAELALLRANQPEAPLSSSTTNEPKTGHADTNGSRDYPCATATGEFHDRTGEPDTLSRSVPFSGDPDRRSREAPMPAAIGRYLVVGRFRHSGQAEVFRVVHPQFQQERVLKLAKEPVGPGGRSEIVEEGKIMSELEHPHLIRVYDLDFLGDRPYLVMEFIRGRNLEQFAAEEQVAPRRAAALVAKVASAAGFAHRRGIVHRDIKPKNILIDEAGEPRLIDFGMARLRTAWSDDRKEPDGGTFAFMAPEQARTESPDDRRKVGPRSDVFALGGVLYFLLTGSAPFPGRTWTEAWDRAHRCAYDAGALFDPKIPAGLRRICLKAMAAEPAMRYPSAEALQKALERFVMRPKVLAAAVGVAGLALVGGLAYALAPPQPDRSHSQSPLAVTHVTSPASLAGELIVRVWSTDGYKRELKPGDPGGLPLLPGEKVRLEARLNQPAYAYLLWVDGQGKASLIYPRDDGKYGTRPTGGAARETVHSPEALDEGHRMKGSGGLETVLLLVRRHPLPTGTDLAGNIGRLLASPLPPRASEYRGIADDADKIDDPLPQLMEKLRTQNQFEVIKAVRFAYRGE
jgi:eukaryotic-like serine/threonine-protein kinase